MERNITHKSMTITQIDKNSNLLNSIRNLVGHLFFTGSEVLDVFGAYYSLHMLATGQVTAFIYAFKNIILG